MGATRKEVTATENTPDQGVRRRATTALVLAVTSIGTAVCAAVSYGRTVPALGEISGKLSAIAATAAMAALVTAATVGPGPARERGVGRDLG